MWISTKKMIKKESTFWDQPFLFDLLKVVGKGYKTYTFLKWVGLYGWFKTMIEFVKEITNYINKHKSGWKTTLKLVKGQQVGYNHNIHHL